MAYVLLLGWLPAVAALVFCGTFTLNAIMHTRLATVARCFVFMVGSSLWKR